MRYSVNNVVQADDYSFNSACLFLGLFKPEWLRFRQMQPDILIIVAAAIALFMLGFTGAGAMS